jgi:hypothetical protein
LSHNDVELDQLDSLEPFEIDTHNAPHLARHGPFDLRDLQEAWFDAPLFYPAKSEGSAAWLMVAAVPGDLILVPLAPARSGDRRKCRPIGLYRPSATLAAQYRSDSR